MPPDSEAFIAEIDDCASRLPSPSAKLESWGKQMDQELEDDRVMREKAIQRLLSRRDPERVKRGVEAYKRDLPQLLREHKDRHVVAYDGETQVAIVPTRVRLLQELIDKGILETDGMFIKVVKPLAEYDDVEQFHSAHSR